MVAECQGGGGGGDLLIKLFGKTIPVPESGDAKDLQQSSSGSSSTEQDLQDAHAPENAHPDTSDASPQPEVVDAEDPKLSSSPPPDHHQTRDDPKPDHHGDSGGAAVAEQQREKLKRPDKLLPCPRCASMDTKFCYFNNYNVNQPRHFCKHCQRYWTAGGAMRNVPVGAGRRKNKNASSLAAAASHFLMHGVRACAAGDTTNGTVLSFGGHGGAPPAPPVCLDLAEQLGHHRASSSARTNRNAAPGPCRSEGSSNNRDRDDDSRCSVVDEAAAAGAAKGDGLVQVQHPAAAASIMNNNNGAAVWPSPYSCAPSPAYFSSGIAIPIYPAAAPAGYWGCMVPGAWSLPWPTTVQQSSPTTTAAASAPSSAAVSSSSGAAAAGTLGLGLGLGKRPRDLEREEGDEGGRREHGKVWAPKTIRIDDVDEVARSSIWSLIGIKGDKTKEQEQDDHKQKQKQIGMVFEPKREAPKKAMMTTTSSLGHANPVALTRSVAFQEGA